MNAKTIIKLMLIIFLLGIYPAENSIADIPEGGYPDSESFLQITSGSGIILLNVFINGVKYIFIFDGIQLIQSYPEG